MTYWQPADAVAAQRTEIVSAPVVPTSPGLIPNDFDGNRSRRRYVRVGMLFDGYRAGLLDTPQQICDLSLSGCFVNSPHTRPDRSRLVLKIDLIQEGTVTLNAETVHHRPGFGFGVRFVDVDWDTSPQPAAKSL